MPDNNSPEEKMYLVGMQYSLLPNTVQKSHSQILDPAFVKDVEEELVYESTEQREGTSEDGENTSLSLPVQTKVMLSYDALPDGELVKYRLKPFDWEVIDAVATLVLGGADVISITKIYKVMIGNPKTKYVAEQAKQRIRESLERCSRARLTMDILGELPKDSEIAKTVNSAEFSSAIINFEAIYLSTNDGGKHAVYRILAVPAVFRYAMALGKVVQYPIEMLNTPINKTEQALLIQSYLLRRIEQIANGQAKSNLIKWADIYAVTEREDMSRTSTKRIRSTVEKILDYWVKFGYIKEYNASSWSYGGITIEPNKNFHAEKMIE